MTIRDSEFPENVRLPSAVERQRLYRPVRYKDVNSLFAPGANDIIVYDSPAVQQKIMNLLSVLVGEEHFEPMWGSNLPLRLFEPVADRADFPPAMRHKLAFMLRTDTITAIDTFMSSEITLIFSACRVTPLTEQDGYEIFVVYIENRTQQRNEFGLAVLRQGS